jgi:formylglycine-generating enzyme required for sulfatase activity
MCANYFRIDKRFPVRVILIFLFLLFSLFSYSQSATFSVPDANFRTALVNHGVSVNFPNGYYGISDNGDGTITVPDIGAVDTLYLGYCNISDASGIEHFTKIKLLNLNFNQLTEIDLSKNTNIEKLIIGGNQLKCLDISMLSKATYLGIGHNSYIDNNHQGRVYVWTLPFPPSGITLACSNATRFWLPPALSSGNYNSTTVTATSNELMYINASGSIAALLAYKGGNPTSIGTASVQLSGVGRSWTDTLGVIQSSRKWTIDNISASIADSVRAILCLPTGELNQLAKANHKLDSVDWNTLVVHQYAEKKYTCSIPATVKTFGTYSEVTFYTTTAGSFSLGASGDTPKTSPDFPAPSLFLPDDNSEKIPVEFLELRWSAVSSTNGDNIYYDVYLGTTPNPALYRSGLYDGWGSEDWNEIMFSETYDDLPYDTYLNFNASLGYETKYYWKVIAKNNKGEEQSSETLTFSTTRQNTLPTPPVMLSPVNNATDVSKNITLQWTASTDDDGDPVTYNLYFGQNSKNPDVQPLLQSGLTTNSYTIPFDLDDQGTYYWKVVAIDGYSGDVVTGDGTNQSWKYTVSNYIADAPVMGTLISPANGITNAAFHVDFAWNAATDKDNGSLLYDVYAGTQPDPQTKIASNLTATSFSHTFGTYGRIYWKVVVKDESGLSDTSDIYSFTTWDKAPGFTIDMANVEGGTFAMGQSDVKSITDPYYINLADEWPEHQVQLDNYQIAKYEITNQQYVEFLNTIVNKTSIINSVRGHRYDGFYYLNVAIQGKDICQVFDSTDTGMSGRIGRNGKITEYEEIYDSPIIWNGTRFSVDPKFTDHPVRFMYAYGAELFAEWAGNYRLPTEAEWEYAALGGKHSHGYEYSGSNNYEDVAVQSVGKPIDDTRYTQPVGTLLPNEFGIYDMTGNVEEICADCYKADFYASPEASGYNPKNTVCSGLERVIRGGNFSHRVSAYLRLKSRDYLGYAQIINTSGIRLAKSTEINKFKISGNIVDIDGISMNGVILMGFSTEQTTDNNGLFNSSEIDGWSGTLTPQATGYTFNPENFEINNLKQDITDITFVGTPVTSEFLVNGKVSDESGNALPNTKITYGDQSVVTNAEGNFSLILSKGWTGNLVPQLQDYTFVPEQFSIQNISESISDVNFTGKRVLKKFTISGTIKDNGGNLLTSVPVAIGDTTILTNNRGEYEITRTESWGGSIAPKKEGYSCAPLTIEIISLDANSSGNDFILTPVPQYFNVSVTITQAGGAPLQDVQIHGFSEVVTTNSNGQFLSAQLQGWNGTIKPAKEGFMFSPADYIIQNLQKDTTLTFIAITITSAESLNEEKLKVYPNPTVTGTVHIVSDESQIKVKLYNLLGVEIENKYIGNNATIQLPGAGVYILQIFCKDKVFVRQLISK